ncbi:hypothetical protein CPB83DRAFT_845808 [Crepidotus variabilis]|uniref:Uncharacterized protein n=1 Tax=Crepidotus variabilis TaxID=179855 RepID=A0A9P6EPM9_9AGAR|nr:hypothetical protein CPB83DRAFT_845808 [Crepidotus variabilis]
MTAPGAVCMLLWGSMTVAERDRVCEAQAFGCFVSRPAYSYATVPLCCPFRWMVIAVWPFRRSKAFLPLTSE